MKLKKKVNKDRIKTQEKSGKIKDGNNEEPSEETTENASQPHVNGKPLGKKNAYYFLSCKLNVHFLYLSD